MITLIRSKCVPAATTPFMPKRQLMPLNPAGSTMKKLRSPAKNGIASRIHDVANPSFALEQKKRSVRGSEMSVGGVAVADQGG